jgi:sugar phosphate isomerase/epimerase
LKILFSTGSLNRLPIGEVFSIARDAGFDGCELVVNKRFNKPEYVDEVTQCLGILPVCSLHAPYVSIPSWGNEKQTLLKSIELAGQLGAEVVTFHPPSWLAREFRFYRWFRKIKDFQKEFGYTDPCLSIENMPLVKSVIPPYILNGYKKLIQFGLKQNLYFTYDITHIGTYGYDIVNVFLKYHETGRLKNIHVSDYSLWRERSHLGIGRGELPIARLLNTVSRLGYDEIVTLELMPQELPRTEEWLLKVMSYSAAYLKLHLNREAPV